MRNKVTALVPARRESSILPDKNLLPFGESNLLVHKLEQLKRVESVEQIIVSSEDKEILDIAQDCGVTALERPREYAVRECPFGSFIEYFCNQVNGEHILWACVTSPLADENFYNKAISKYFEIREEGYDSLITVQKQKRFLLDKNGTINFKRGLKHKESEFLSELYLFTNSAVIAPRLSMIEWKYTWGYIPYKMLIDKRTGIDINDEFDYQIARFLYEKGTLNE